jgi:hypothetical protein
LSSINNEKPAQQYQWKVLPRRFQDGG